MLDNFESFIVLAFPQGFILLNLFKKKKVEKMGREMKQRWERNEVLSHYQGDYDL